MALSLCNNNDRTVKGETMNKAEITFTFDLQNKRDRRVYEGLMKLPQYFGGTMTEAFMSFYDRLVYTLSECEQRMQKCENLLIQVADQSVGKKEGHA
jgi:hypothetical protein